MVDGIRPAIAMPWKKRRTPSCHGALTIPCGIVTIPERSRQANKIRAEPMRSANLPSLDANSILAKPAAENIAPDTIARWSMLPAISCT